MTISRRVDPEKELTTLVVSGELSYEKWLDAHKSIYEEHPTKNLLWDFRNADFYPITSRDVEFMADYVQKHGHLRAGGKTAWVVSKALEFGMLRMAETFGEIRQLPFEIRLFHSMDEATQWLDEDGQAS